MPSSTGVPNTSFRIASLYTYSIVLPYSARSESINSSTFFHPYQQERKQLVSLFALALFNTLIPLPTET